MSSLVELVLDVHAAFAAASVSHAFGGALALGFLAEPRGTVDIDVNVFVDPEHRDMVDAALAALGYRAEDDGVPMAGIRFTSTGSSFPIDVFPSLHPRYAEVEARAVSHPFGPDAEPLPFLSAIDLAVFKLSFGRPKDWVDLTAIATAVPDLDIDAVADLLIELRGPSMHPRVARLRGLLSR